MVNEALQFVRSASWALSRRVGNRALSVMSWSVFALLDVTDQLLCPVFAFLDSFLDSEKRVCYCDRSHNDIHHSGGDQAADFNGKESLSQLLQLSDEGDFNSGGGNFSVDSWIRSSDTLYARVGRFGRTRFNLLALHRTLSVKNNIDSTEPIIPYKGIISEQIQNSSVVDDKLLLPVAGVEGDRNLSNRGVIGPTETSHFGTLTKQSIKGVICRQRIGKQVVRWSDCGCQRCTAWQSEKDQLLYVHVEDKDFLGSISNEPNAANIATAENNVIFLHGFLSSSSFWADTVLHLPDSVRSSHRLFAVDLLGFGRSPKPSNSMYTMAEHIDMIRRSVLEPYGIQKFHLVAHSMGCTVALALAANYPSALNSITVIAPPYVPSVAGEPSSTDVMEQLAARRVWPLITFGSSVMSWYEHIGRVVCFVVCKHHRFWEPLLFFVHSKLPGTRAPLSCVTDFTRHTHHSAWHVFHNTICNGGQAADHCLEVLKKAGKRVRVIHGTRDAVVPFKSSMSLSERHPNVRLTTVTSADHGTVVFGREAQLAEELAEEILHI
ncbi:unnamed protein product [Calypogeia fissa]